MAELPGLVPVAVQDGELLECRPYRLRVGVVAVEDPPELLVELGQEGLDLLGVERQRSAPRLRAALEAIQKLVDPGVPSAAAIRWQVNEQVERLAAEALMPPANPGAQG